MQQLGLFMIVTNFRQLIEYRQQIIQSEVLYQNILVMKLAMPRHYINSTTEKGPGYTDYKHITWEYRYY
jgi:hypothetical protein